MGKRPGEGSGQTCPCLRDCVEDAGDQARHTYRAVRSPRRGDSASARGDMGDMGYVGDTVEDTLQRMEYRVIELLEKRIGGALSGHRLEEILNDEAREGWMLKSITHADVKGRIGPGAVEGLIITFERPVA